MLTQLTWSPDGPDGHVHLERVAVTDIVLTDDPKQVLPVVTQATDSTEGGIGVHQGHTVPV